jgi:hypothetical protein
MAFEIAQVQLAIDDLCIIAHCGQGKIGSSLLLVDVNCITHKHSLHSKTTQSRKPPSDSIFWQNLFTAQALA